MNNYKIIELVPQKNAADFNKIMPAFLSIWNHPENHKFLSLTLQLFSHDIVDYWFKNHLDLGARYFAAIDDNQTILALSVIKISHVETFEIFGLGVHPEHKSKGIGSSLIRNSIELASSLGFKAIDVSVYVDNFIMMRLLLSYKFVPIRINYHARADGTDIIVMKKYL